MGNVARPKPLADFRTYPAGKNGKLFFRVRVFSTKKEMSEFVNCSIDKNPKCGDFDALCVSSDQWKDGTLTNEIGRMYFNLKSLGGFFVSHECAHAAFRYLERKNISLEDQTSVDPTRASDSEESFCYALGTMVRQIYDKLLSSGLVHPINGDS
jgi:hypothetical protein